MWRPVSVASVQVSCFVEFLRLFRVHPGCKESQFYSLPFGQAVASIY